ncbi:MAG: hypothetical protein ACRECQ_06635 [Burkholderiaceae bacterium]
MKRWLALSLFAVVAIAAAQGTGGLYIAGSNFGFAQTVERAVAQNPTPSKFFVLAVGEAVRGLSVVAPPELVEARNLGAKQGAVYLVCRRDIEREVFQLTDLVSGVVPVRGWPAPGSNELPEGKKYYANEDPSNLPNSNELLRRLRATCS